MSGENCGIELARCADDGHSHHDCGPDLCWWAPDHSRAAMTDPPSVRCSWCGGRTWWENGGYWLTCPTSGHPSRHDPRIHGWFWHLRVLVGV